MTRKFRYWVLLLFGLLMIAGLARLRFDVDVLNLLPGDLPVVRGLQLYQRNFTDSRELILTVRAPDAARAQAAARTLAQFVARRNQSGCLRPLAARLAGNGPFRPPN